MEGSIALAYAISNSASTSVRPPAPPVCRYSTPNCECVEWLAPKTDDVTGGLFASIIWRASSVLIIFARATYSELPQKPVVTDMMPIFILSVLQELAGCVCAICTNTSWCKIVNCNVKQQGKKGTLTKLQQVKLFTTYCRTLSRGRLTDTDSCLLRNITRFKNKKKHVVFRQSKLKFCKKIK